MSVKVYNRHTNATLAVLDELSESDFQILKELLAVNHGINPSDLLMVEYIKVDPPEPTIEDIKKMLRHDLQQLDNPRDAESIFDALKEKNILTDVDIPEATLDRFTKKKELRQRLRNLEVTNE